MARLPALVAAAGCVMGCAQAKTFNVLDFGAKGDGATLDTAAVRAALASAVQAKGGEVVFPPGYVFLTRPFNLTSNLLLSVQGTIMFSDDPSADWPLVPEFAWFGPTTSPQFQPLMMAWEDSDNITINGGGVINGNGTKWWPCAVQPSVAPCFGVARPPALLFTYKGVGLTVHNVTIRDAPMWNLRPSFMDYVHIFNVTIQAPASTEKVNPSHNTDGVDPDCSRHVLVEDCDISVGDDAIAIKAGMDWYGRAFGRPSYNLTFRNLRIGTAHGVSIGSEMSAGISDVLFEKFTMTGTSTGPRLKTQRGRGGYIANITFRDFALDGVGEVLQVTEYYSSNLPPQNASATPHFSNITIQRLTAVNSPAKKSIGLYFAGLPESPIQGLTLEDVDLGTPATVFANCSYTGGQCRGTVLPSCPPCLTPA